MTDTTTTTWLDRYHDWGWAVVPIPQGQKFPVLNDWPNLRREDHDDWPALFEDQGIGVILGEASGHLIDVDLDSPEAVAVASRIMTPTLMGGRDEAPWSHWFYRCSNIPEDYYRNRQFHDPVSGAGRPVLEFRVNGQTVVAPSIHPSGDTYDWWSTNDDLAEVTWSHLAADIVLTAALSLLAMYWPDGGRHHAAMHLAGALLHDNGPYWSQGYRLEAAIEAVCAAAGDHEVGDRLTAVRNTLEKHDREEPVTGWSSLVKLYEAKDAGAAAQAAREWLAPMRADEPDEEEVEEYDGQYGMFTDLRVDLRQIITDGVPQPTAIYPGFLYANMEHLTFGNAGVGKTMLTAHVLDFLAQREEHVIWLDYQNGFADIANRFVTLQSDLDMLHQYVHVIDHPPANLLDPGVLRDLQSMMVDLDAAVVVFDSMMDVLSFARSEMNSGDDFNSLHSRAIKPLRQTGRSALWFHDHAAKHDPFSSIGTSMKKNQTQAEWHIGNTISGVTRVPNRTVGGDGFIVATAGKNRSGVIAKGHKVVWDVIPHGPTERDSETGIVTHVHTKVELRGHYPPGSTIPMPGMSPP